MIQAAGLLPFRSDPVVGRRRRLVLVADDDVAIREMVAELIREEPDLAAEAVRAQDVLRVADEMLPDLVLLDLSMPGIDGFELARQLRSQRATAALPLVAMTAFGRGPQHARALAAGFDEVLDKPFEIGDLIALLRRYLFPDEAARQRVV